MEDMKKLIQETIVEMIKQKEFNLTLGIEELLSGEKYLVVNISCPNKYGDGEILE